MYVLSTGAQPGISSIFGISSSRADSSPGITDYVINVGYNDQLQVTHATVFVVNPARCGRNEYGEDSGGHL
jgi:hypothetical protein